MCPLDRATRTLKYAIEIVSPDGDERDQVPAGGRVHQFTDLREACAAVTRSKTYAEPGAAKGKAIALHAKEAPDRVWELEAWVPVFDRTKDGRISQRNFGGNEHPRLAHVGDLTGLEMIRTLQQKVVALQQQDAIEFGDPEGDDQGLRRDHDHRSHDGRRADRRGVRVLQGHRAVRVVPGARGGARHRRHRQDVQGHLELLGIHRRRARAGAAPPGPPC